MKKTAYIYKITNIKTNKCYVGFTENPDIRWHEHQAAQHFETMPLHKAIRDEGKQNFSFEILYKSENIKHTLFTMETFFIGLHRSHISLGGYNVNFGGDHPFLKRDGYTILLQSSDLGACDVTINSDVVDSTPINTDIDYSAWTKKTEVIPRRNPYKDSFDANRCLSLVKRINTDGKNAIGKFYLLTGDKILCFSSREKFIAHCNKIPGCSPLKLLQNTKNMNERGMQLSYDLLKNYRVRGIFAVFVVEHLLINVPSGGRRRRGGRQKFRLGSSRHSFSVNSSTKKTKHSL